MRITRATLLLFMFLLGLGLLLTVGRGPALAQGGNLLNNPGFEGQYSGYTPETAQEQADCPMGFCSTAQTASGWKPWWIKERPTDVNPEFKPAESNVPGNRVYAGERSAQYFSFWSTHKAGLRQTVTVPSGALVQFSIQGHAWMTESDTSFVSDRSGTPNMRIGIDPTGGSNPFNPAIVWSGFIQAYDTYQLFSVTARAQGDKVTVFTFSAPSVNPNSPTAGFKHTDIYWDNAALTVVGAGAPPPPAPNNDGGSNPPPPVVAPRVIGPTATPNAEGEILAEVQAGDSLWAIAARAGISLDQLLELNGITRDEVVRAGDLLIVGNGEPPSEETEAVVEATAEASSEEQSLKSQPTEKPKPSPTAESISMIAQDASTVSICLTAFEDANQNGQKDAGETLRADVAFTISDSQSVVSNYVSDGASEPFCVSGLAAGTYQVTRSKLPGEVLTTAGDHSASLTEGSSLSLSFGSHMTEEASAVADTAAPDESASDTAENGASQSADEGSDFVGIAGLIAVVVAVLLLVAVLVIILSARRTTV